MLTGVKKHLMITVGVVLACSLTLGLLPGCAGSGSGSEAQDAIEAVQPVPVRVATLKGAGAMGMVWFDHQASAGELYNGFQLVTATSGATISSAIQNGEADIVVVPVDVATRLYNANPGTVQVASIETIGGLHLVSSQKGKLALEELAGKTVYLSVTDSNASEHVLRCLLNAKGLSDQVTIVSLGTPSEVVAMLSADREAVGVLPEPYVTAAGSTDKHLRSSLDLSKVWSEVCGEDAQIVSWVTMVSTEFAQSHPEALEEFLGAQEESTQAFANEPDELSELAVAAGLVDDIEIAEASFPLCGMTCITGNKMHVILADYLTELYEYDPALLGNVLPEVDFYYLGA